MKEANFYGEGVFLRRRRFSTRKAHFSGISFSFSGNIPAHLRWATNELTSFVTRVPTPQPLTDGIWLLLCYVTFFNGYFTYHCSSVTRWDLAKV